jgi:hypothetical protein
MKKSAFVLIVEQKVKEILKIVNQGYASRQAESLLREKAKNSCGPI